MGLRRLRRVRGPLLFIGAGQRGRAVLSFVLGYYPVLYGVLAKIKNKAARWVVKLLLVNAAAGLEVALSFFLLHIPVETGGLMAAVWLGLNAVFFLYDMAVRQLIDLYFAKLRPRLQKAFRVH